MGAWIRPDGRCFVRKPADAAAAGLGRDTYAHVDEADELRLHAFRRVGFAVHRRELELLLPTDPALTGLADASPPAGLVFLRADEVGEERLRLLDDALRQDVPGTDGWRWQPADFRAETYESAHFDPALYLVAIADGGAPIALARIWNRPSRPRLGLIGVLPTYRRRGVAWALLAQVLAVLHERGRPEVATEVDEANTPSRALLERIGGRQVGASLELVRRYRAG